ncbi:flagellar hook assembly protein FlgD [Sphingosinicella terrae]|jgi:flagellar basal-body rod modification protein FlgD|uniref:flagellar hook assembly protein FlgD n=1 Tax=Sphingosinicella terrae TaxID=2172047 RepID=UPI000E0D65E5|nr:flagellar hook capping FlgD N-terminal domain-containing protein [Sphingosinicella terrae]
MIDPISSNAPGSTTGAGPANGLDQNAFLRLLTTQLTTQDPFNPVDNTQMVAQMAQFSQVAGIAEMNQKLEAIAGALTGNRIGDAASWIGRAMLVEADVATPLRDGSYAGELELGAAADQVTVSLVDENGSVVRNITLGAQEAGPVHFSWDGLGEDGEPVNAGPLRVVVNARAGGSPVETATATWTTIGGIQSPANGGEARLVTGLGLLAPDAAIRIS